MSDRLKAVVVGYGNRGEIYAAYALRNPEELEIVAVTEPDLRRRRLAQKNHHLRDDRIFSDLDGFLKRRAEADFIINATMDALHYPTTKLLLEAGYNVLLEKPVTSDKSELLELESLAREKKVKLSVCHVLRYTPFYSRIKQHILDSSIGEIIHIESSESIGIPHFLCAYVRGKWRDSKVCGSSLLLAKCSHDIDIVCWLNNSSVPQKVSSFGSRSRFIPEKSPAGSGTRCLTDCPYSDECIYSAKHISVDNNLFPYYVWEETGTAFESLSREQRIEKLKSDSDFGICAFKTGGDIVDRQIVNIEFANGSVAVHSVTGGASRPARKIHIIGTKGEIEGVPEHNRYVLRIYDHKQCLYGEKEFIIPRELVQAGHSGGDDKIISDFIKYIRGEQRSISSSDIHDSVIGHLCVYAADKSMKSHTAEALGEK